MNNIDTYIFASLLVLLSAICSGLNLALMSLQVADLKRKAKTGNIKAQLVLPLRKKSNLTLSSILLTNVAAASSTSLVLGSAFSGIVAGVSSTMLLVIFGEIFPQALFSRHALSVCAWLVPLLRIMIVITYPIAKPLQLLLDKLFGGEINHLHTRHELGLLIAEHTDHKDTELDDDEIEIIKGALKLSEKRVRDIMTPIKKVFWLSDEAIIDADKIDEIKDENYSRIPIFNKELNECKGILLMKELVDIDFDEQPMSLDELKLRPTKMVGSMTALDTLFRKFIVARTHLMPVEKDDVVVGIVTIEDLVEEIIGHEIEDEGDDRR